MPIEKKTPRFEVGQPIRASELNKLGDVAEYALHYFGDRTLEGGTDDEGGPEIADVFFGLIGKVSDYRDDLNEPANACYAVQRAVAKTSLVDGNELDLVADAFTSEGSYVLATNQLELGSNNGTGTSTHLLKTDGTVRVLVVGLAYRHNPVLRQYVFWQQAASPTLFGTLKTAWPEFSDHNLVTLTPCVSASDDTTLTDDDGNPLPDVTAYIQCPIDSTPPFFAVDVDQVLDYYTDPDGNNILLHVPMPGSNSLYDLPQITSLVHAKGTGGCGPLRAQ